MRRYRSDYPSNHLLTWMSISSELPVGFTPEFGADFSGIRNAPAVGRELI